MGKFLSLKLTFCFKKESKDTQQNQGNSSGTDEKKDTQQNQENSSGTDEKKDTQQNQENSSGTDGKNECCCDKMFSDTLVKISCKLSEKIDDALAFYNQTNSDKNECCSSKYGSSNLLISGVRTWLLTQKAYESLLSESFSWFKDDPWPMNLIGWLIRLVLQTTKPLLQKFHPRYRLNQLINKVEESLIENTKEQLINIKKLLTKNRLDQLKDQLTNFIRRLGELLSKLKDEDIKRLKKLIKRLRKLLSKDEDSVTQPESKSPSKQCEGPKEELKEELRKIESTLSKFNQSEKLPENIIEELKNIIEDLIEFIESLIEPLEQTAEGEIGYLRFIQTKTTIKDLFVFLVPFTGKDIGDLKPCKNDKIKKLLEAFVVLEMHRHKADYYHSFAEEYKENTKQLIKTIIPTGDNTIKGTCSFSKAHLKRLVALALRDIDTMLENLKTCLIAFRNVRQERMRDAVDGKLWDMIERRISVKQVNIRHFKKETKDLLLRLNSEVLNEKFTLSTQNQHLKQVYSELNKNQNPIEVLKKLKNEKSLNQELEKIKEIAEKGIKACVTAEKGIKACVFFIDIYLNKVENDDESILLTAEDAENVIGLFSCALELYNLHEKTKNASHNKPPDSVESQNTAGEVF
ncbi:MAG: hypothetical protein D6687_04015 [Acidobacteria bacterium]|jgi:hypothetical protein|nr:MAG: hypothetical protein D6687_04015 [Acidobacteriota bacterium]